MGEGAEGDFLSGNSGFTWLKSRKQRPMPVPALPVVQHWCARDLAAFVSPAVFRHDGLPNQAEDAFQGLACFRNVADRRKKPGKAAPMLLPESQEQVGGQNCTGLRIFEEAQEPEEGIGLEGIPAGRTAWGMVPDSTGLGTAIRCSEDDSKTVEGSHGPRRCGLPPEWPCGRSNEDQMKMGSVAGIEFFRHEKRNIRENPFVTATEKPETIAVSGFSFAGGRI